MSVSLMVGLLVGMVTQGSTSGIPVFVPTGKDLFLEVKETAALKQNSDFIWKLNGSYIIVKAYYDNRPSIRRRVERAEFSGYNLVLKNVQSNESGIYTANVYGTISQPVAEYEVTVFDPVSPVHLTVKPSHRSDSCRLSVTCTTQDAHVNTTVRCNNGTCSQEGGEASGVTPSGASLRVYLVDGLIICNHSNQVSSSKDLLMTKDFCFDGSECVSTGFSMCWVKMAVISTGLAIMVSAVICVHVIEKLRKQ